MLLIGLGAVPAYAEEAAGVPAGSVTVRIEENDTPLAGGPFASECCALHLAILLAALGGTLWYIHSDKAHQAQQFALRRRLATPQNV